VLGPFNRCLLAPLHSSSPSDCRQVGPAYTSPSRFRACASLFWAASKSFGSIAHLSRSVAVPTAGKAIVVDTHSSAPKDRLSIGSSVVSIVCVPPGCSPSTPTGRSWGRGGDNAGRRCVVAALFQPPERSPSSSFAPLILTRENDMKPFHGKRPSAAHPTRAYGDARENCHPNGLRNHNVSPDGAAGKIYLAEQGNSDVP
jgi:hypothetical protein